MKLNKIFSTIALAAAVFGLAACSDTDAKYTVADVDAPEWVSITPNESGVLLFGERTVTVTFDKNVFFATKNLDMVLDCDLLIIDDLGTENGNSYTVSQLFTCMEERQLRAKPIVITTNLNMEQIRARYSERIASRLFSNYRYIKLMGDDIRVRKLFLEGSPD